LFAQKLNSIFHPFLFYDSKTVKSFSFVATCESEKIVVFYAIPSRKFKKVVKIPFLEIIEKKVKKQKATFSV
jgi:hypothetical protein